MKYPTEEQKAEALKKYNLYRDRIVLRYLRKLKAKVKATEKNATTPAEWQEHYKLKNRYWRLAEAFWDGKVKRPWGPSRPFPWKYNPKPAAVGEVKRREFNGPPWVTNPENPRYGQMPEGWFYLVLDGREYEKLVTIDVDDENATVILRSKRG